jgi:hypothetical protein
MSGRADSQQINNEKLIDNPSLGDYTQIDANSDGLTLVRLTRDFNTFFPGTLGALASILSARVPSCFRGFERV